MSFVAAVALSILGFVPQDEDLSLEEELAALVERTNRIETLHLVYDIQSEEDGEVVAMTLELVYRAPDFGRMRIDSPEGAMDQWLLGDRLYLQREEEWQRATMPPLPPTRVVLDELFPRADGALEPGVAFWIVLRREADGSFQFNLTCGNTLSDRNRLLGWLWNLQNWTGVVAEGDELRWEEDGLRCVVERQSGLLKEVHGRSNKGWLRVTLRESLVDEPLAPEQETLPEQARAAPESEELVRVFMKSRTDQRREVFARVAGQLASGQRKWNSLARQQWEEVLGVLHREAILQGQAKTLAGLREGISAQAERMKRDRAEGDSPERRAWEEIVAESRAHLASHLDEGEPKYRASMEALELPGVELRPELLDVEAEVIAALWDELVRAPMLALFDESFAEAAK